MKNARLFVSERHKAAVMTDANLRFVKTLRNGDYYDNVVQGGKCDGK